MGVAKLPAWKLTLFVGLVFVIGIMAPQMRMTARAEGTTITITNIDQNTAICLKR